MSWQSHFTAMSQKTGRADAPASLPRDVFPTENDLRLAVLVDEFIDRISRIELEELTEVLDEFASEEDALFMAEVDHRLDAAFPTGAQKGRL